ncbi:MAG: metal ABC transporter permease [Ruminococcaceae bacterium]|nr:metal ABC transporter permease [Oscillospiraceae bacterium]
MILQMLSYPFMQRALVAGALISLCCALLGVSLVLKRYSMIGDGLSHVSFGALAIAVALGFTPLYFSIPVVILAAFLLLRMASRPHWNNDAAIAVLSASSLAIGILVISLTTGMTTDVDNYMFGSVLAMTEFDVFLSVVLSIAVLILFVLFYHKLFAITFDESFSRATGLRVDIYNSLLAILTALTIVLGMRMMGAMLISSLIIFPALTAMRLFRSFRGVVICAGVSAVVCFAAGLTASFLLSTPVGASVVVADLTVFLAACCIQTLRKR